MWPGGAAGGHSPAPAGSQGTTLVWIHPLPHPHWQQDCTNIWCKSRNDKAQLFSMSCISCLRKCQTSRSDHVIIINRS